jgi:hypothetical protein
MLPWLLLFLLLAGSTAVGLYLWQTRINIPRLSYTPLPPYEVPDVILIGGVVVENRGRRAAPNVKITIRFQDESARTIHHFKVDSLDHAILRSGGEQYNFASVSARSLRAHGTIFIYWVASRDEQPQIAVTSYQPTPTSLAQKLLPRRTDS